MKVDDVEHHHMHSEFYMITEESAQKINMQKKQDIVSSVSEQQAAEQSNPLPMRMED